MQKKKTHIFLRGIVQQMAALRCDESTSGETNRASFRRQRRNEFRQNKLSLKSTLPAGLLDGGGNNPACFTAKVLFWHGHYDDIHERRVAGFVYRTFGDLHFHSG